MTSVVFSNCIAMMCVLQTGLATASSLAEEPTTQPSAAAIERLRVEYLEKNGTIAYERVSDVSKFLPASFSECPEHWIVVKYNPPDIVDPHLPMLVIPTRGLQYTVLPPPPLSNNVYWCFFRYAERGIACDIAPYDIKDSALHHLWCLEEIDKKVPTSLAKRVRTRIEGEQSLQIMRGALELSSKVVKRAPATVEDALYDYVLTQAAIANRIKGSEVVRELSRDSRVVFCSGSRELLTSKPIRVQVYEDAQPLYEILVVAALGESERPSPTTSPELVDIVGSAIEFGLRGRETKSVEPDEKGEDSER